MPHTVLELKRGEDSFPTETASLRRPLAHASRELIIVVITHHETDKDLERERKVKITIPGYH